MKDEELEKLWYEAISANLRYRERRVPVQSDENALPSIMSALLVIAAELRRIREALEWKEGL